MKAAVEHVQAKYAFSEHRACRLLLVPVSSYRYKPRHRDEIYVSAWLCWHCAERSGSTVCARVRRWACIPRSTKSGCWTSFTM
jgi:hypothetical protein